MQLRCRHWVLGLVVIAGRSFAQEDAAERYARAEQLRGDARTRAEAMELYRQAAELWKGREEEGRARWRLGQLFELGGDRQRALVEFEAGLARARDPKLVAGLHYGMGRVLVATGKGGTGIEHYRKAAELRGQTGERFEQGLALHNLGSAYWTLGRNAEAMRTFGEALLIRRELADEAGVAYTLFGMGNVHYSWGDLERALRQYEGALEVWRRLQQSRGQADCLNAIGLMYALLGDNGKARLHYGEALRMWAKAQDRAGEAYTLSNLGMVEGAAGRASLEKALAALREQGDRLGQAYVLHNLGMLDGAYARFEESLAIKREFGDRYGEAQTLEKLGEAYLKAGRAEEALRCAREAAELDREVGNRLGEAAAEAVRGRALLQLGRKEEARTATGAALELVEGLRAAVVSVELRSRFFATQQRVYREAIAVLMELGQAAQAFEVSERGRARVLLDRVMAARGESGFKGGTEEAKLAREIHAVAQRVQRLGGEKNAGELVAARRQLERLFEEWSRMMRQREQLEGVAVRPVLARLRGGVLDGRTALVEYFVDGEQCWAWVVTRAGVTAVRLRPRQVLAAAAGRQRAALAARREAGAELMGMLIEPLRLGRGIERLVLVLDGPLCQVSLQAVAGMLDRYEVVEVPSAATLIALRERPARVGPRSVRIVADPEFGVADGYGKLHFSRMEGEGIAQLAGAGEARQYSGPAAGKELLESREFREASIVHLATHAQVDAERPELSAVVFAGVDGKGRARNGHLRLYEIYRLRLRAELVVLSGCTTGVGTELAGEGTMSLARGFLYAGAGKVLASQWAVDDRATAELMVRFYEGLLRKRLPAAAALRSAQQAMRGDARWKDPYYWAGFTLVGDWR